MRSFKRNIRLQYSEFRHRVRIAEIKSEISYLYNDKIKLVRSGSRGADSIYVAIGDGGQRLGVLRLVNPFRKRKRAASGMPYIVLDGPERVKRELEAYSLGGPNKITPKVIWHAEDALLCEYYDGYTSLELYKKSKINAVQLLEIGWNALKSAHNLGILHMDASIENILISRNLEEFRLVDFEFGAADFMTFEDQCVYDYLRYLESFLKFLEPQSYAALTDFIQSCDLLKQFTVTPDKLNQLMHSLIRLKRNQKLLSVVESSFGEGS
ncbi:hypothetical protein [Sneathiella glossodoripedis]|uniref:hypothetical protein n=1 Tax=Sneathiella glossodoripedis TaxID=418853 RepID=UPI00046E6171|nr:hypothetical protein [Sneathiella glossodoripedis]